ncbi:MAG: hypothetical protein AAFY56_04800, partial [Pseudomonadota bacterium]
KNSPIPKQSYGYPHLTLCWDGEFPPLAKADRIHLCWIERHEFADSCKLLPEHERYPVALPTAVTAEAEAEAGEMTPNDLISS